MQEMRILGSAIMTAPTSADDVVAAKADDAPFAVDALNKVATESREMARLRETRSPSRLQLEAWATTATKSAGIIEVLRQENAELRRALEDMRPTWPNSHLL